MEIRVAERAINTDYTEHSRKQIESIKARYRAGAEYSKNLLGETEGPWLDIGANVGYGLPQLPACRKGVFAIDTEIKYLQKALEQNSRVKGMVMDACHLGCNNGCIATVSCFEVIEHMEEPRQKELLAEIHRVLEPGGVLVISTPDKTASGKRRRSPDHERELTFKELERLLTEQGFAIKEVLGESFYNNGLFHRVFRGLRENPLVVLAYYRLIPWSLRSGLRDAFSNSQDGTTVRKPRANETARINFVVCQKSE